MVQTKLVSPEEISDHKAVCDRKTIVAILSENGFEADSIRTGYFDGCVNVWAVARKVLGFKYKRRQSRELVLFGYYHYGYSYRYSTSIQSDIRSLWLIIWASFA
jgi:hypothetical protein